MTMTSEQKDARAIAIRTAIAEAINAVGLPALKATSLFGRNWKKYYADENLQLAA